MTNTLLINKDHKIKNSYFNKVKLQKIKNYKDEEILIEENTYQAFLKLQAFLKTKKITIAIDSAYRSLEDQEKLYYDYTKYYGEDYATKIVAPVGYSEHHTGLAIDIVVLINNHFPKDNTEVLNHIEEYQRLVPYLSKFGFIIRYPEGKENITGYPYEPWHIRYVGSFVASIIAPKNWTLEEYHQNFSGLIAINKEKNMTSFDVVHEISKLFGLKKVGHTGTLDPLAEGVLIVAIGKATKIVELVTAEYKEYIASVNLGYETDTLDITGKVTIKKTLPKDLAIKEVIKSFQKTYYQEVPLYSAIKVHGKKLYEYARNNIDITPPQKEVTIKEIELLNQTPTSFTFKALVSKGCYIRSLIRDIAHALNTYGTMSSLIRTKQGNVTLEKTSTLQQVKENHYHLLAITDVLNYPVITVTDQLKAKIIHGCKIKNTFSITNKVIFQDKDNNLLGIYEVQDDNLIVWKNFI